MRQWGGVVRLKMGSKDYFKNWLSAVVTNGLTIEVRQEATWTMVFADSIVLCSESREQIKENPERWRYAVERRGIKSMEARQNTCV